MKSGVVDGAFLTNDEIRRMESFRIIMNMIFIFFVFV